MKIVFFGASKFVLPIIELLNNVFGIALVVTTEKSLSHSVPEFCRESNIPYISISKFDESIKARLREINAPIAVLAYFGMLVPKDVLGIFPKGILNIHPSLLPLYRGATPVQTTLLNGDTEAGVTIIKLDEQIDHGPILYQEKEGIAPEDTTESLHDRLFRRGAVTLGKLIPDYLSGKIKMQPQNEAQATYSTRSLKRVDGYIDSDNPPDKERLDRMIRAYYPWPVVWTKVRTDKRELRIKFLPDKKVQVEGGKPMIVKDFLNGYPQLKEQLKNILPV